MIPPLAHPVWMKLLKGQKQVVSTQLAVNMLLTNLRLRYRMNQSEENVAKLTQHAYDFFAKFERQYESEVKQIIQ
ncbi:MAG: hypothetical protein P4M01_09390 [Acidobacteriota bacterium]|nr:hypothetical protein [Acidobacteriota bacterium]